MYDGTQRIRTSSRNRIAKLAWNRRKRGRVVGPWKRRRGRASSNRGDWGFCSMALAADLTAANRGGERWGLPRGGDIGVRGGLVDEHAEPVGVAARGRARTASGVARRRPSRARPSSPARRLEPGGGAGGSAQAAAGTAETSAVAPSSARARRAVGPGRHGDPLALRVAGSRARSGRARRAPREQAHLARRPRQRRQRARPPRRPRPPSRRRAPRAARRPDRPAR